MGFASLAMAFSFRSEVSDQNQVFAPRSNFGTGVPESFLILRDF